MRKGTIVVRFRPCSDLKPRLAGCSRIRQDATFAEPDPSEDDDKESGPVAQLGLIFPAQRAARRPGQAIQYNLRFGADDSNCAISAVFGALPLKVSTLP